MTEKAKARREALRGALIDAAEKRIVLSGTHSLRARDLASDVGCALGAIYTVFPDLNALVMEVNGRTFRRIGQAVGAKVDPALGPVDQLIALSLAYLDFARDNTRAWRALFDLEMSADGPVPDWYLAALEHLFAHIARPVAQIFPELDQAEVGVMTRGLFSAVHGIVLLGLERRISAVPHDQVAQMIARILGEIGNRQFS
jgi:AcrR family transcriptional regulator